MQFLYIDFETYYSGDYSLRKMTPVEYILDPQFECIGAALAEDDGKPFWLDHNGLVSYLESNDLSKVKVVSHNALFDMSILAWRYNFVPFLMIDTLSLARAKWSYKLVSLSLAKVAAHLNIGAKGDAIIKVMGMNSAAMKQNGLYEALTSYALNDVSICRDIWKALQPFPLEELVICDMVQRCAIQPKFVLDQNILHQHLHNTQQSKQSLLERAGLADRESLMSNDKFASALLSLGVVPPRKTSLVTGKETWAFSKTDASFLALEEHPDADVQALVAARIGAKSTLEETRTKKFINISNLQWPNGAHSLMPVPLRYSGAHTHRLSGDWGLNLQNLPRGGSLRAALKAPLGHQVVTCDSAQIEARMVAWFCEQENLVDQFAKGEDVYSTFASSVFSKTINKKEHPDERFIGKTAVLGLGFGMGAPKFQKTVQTQSKNQLGKEIILDDYEAQKIVNIYRDLYPNVKGMWTTLNGKIQTLTDQRTSEFLGPVTDTAAGVIYLTHEKVTLPSQLSLHYHKLRQVISERGNEWVYDYGRIKDKRLFGGKLLENIIQALARIVVMDAALRLRKPLEALGVQLSGQVHDELIYIVPDEHVEFVKELVLKEMCVRPRWALALPLAAEAGSGPSYGDAK
jgi:DNA polymerase